jgi:hypothetical protein
MTLTATSVILKWEPPQDPNGEITAFNINVEAISTDAATFMMGMGGTGGTGGGGGGAGDRRKRQVMTPVNLNCIVGGGTSANRNFSTPGTRTTLTVSNLSEYRSSINTSSMS